MRTSKTAGGVTTTFLLDKNRDYAQVVVETIGSTNVTYSYGHDLISQTRPGTGTRFYQYDGQLSTRQLTSATGGVTDMYTYDAFGVLLSSTGSTPNVYLYTGEQLDPNVGFYYLRARYYDQAAGRFTTTDPEQGSVFDPVSLHRYLYANADPVDNWDPSGRLTLPEISVTLNVISLVSLAASFVANLAGYKKAAGVLQIVSIFTGVASFGVKLLAAKAASAAPAAAGITGELAKLSWKTPPSKVLLILFDLRRQLTFGELVTVLTNIRTYVPAGELILRRVYTLYLKDVLLFSPKANPVLRELELAVRLALGLP
jgi:RHS repeat-associated protein